MFLGIRTVVYPVADLAVSTAWFGRALGIKPYFDQPFYVGFDVGGYELGLMPVEPQRAEPAPGGNGGPTTYWGVPDADRAVERLVELGAQPGDPVADVGDGIRLGTVVEPGGNVLGVIENPHFALPAEPPPAAGPGR